MTVAQLIEFLKTQPQEMLVAYDIYSESALMEADMIKVQDLCIAREDGWLHHKRPDMPSQPYLVFPGN